MKILRINFGNTKDKMRDRNKTQETISVVLFFLVLNLYYGICDIFLLSEDYVLHNLGKYSSSKDGVGQYASFLGHLRAFTIT
jgi:hypothetical protein